MGLIRRSKKKTKAIFLEKKIDEMWRKKSQKKIKNRYFYNFFIF